MLSRENAELFKFFVEHALMTEFVNHPNDGSAFCVHCYADSPHHAEGCKLARALARVKEIADAGQS